MIPNSPFYKETSESVLHVCGDDPQYKAINKHIDQCSPRMWR